MKKFLAILLVLLLLVSALAGCGNKNNANINNETADNQTENTDYAYLFRELPEAKYITSAADFAGGDGSENDPYQISNAAELALLHEKMVAEHKKHIHMEKPGGVNLADFEKLIETAKNNKTVFHTGYVYRYNPYIIELKEQIKNGELGDIISVEAQMNCIHPKEKRQWLDAFPGGMMFFLGCHLIDLIFDIQGTPKNIIPLNRCSGVEDVTSNDFGMVVFEYENGVSFAKTSAVEIGGFERRQLVVSGTKKTVELKPLEWYLEPGHLVTGRNTYESRGWHTPSVKEQSGVVDRYDSMMRSFGKMAAGEKENPWGYEYELKLFETVLKCCGGEKL